jgi:hypothetical protein
LPTPRSEEIPEPWCSFLRELDSAVQEEVRLDCIGGFVVTTVYGFSRPTADLNVFEIAPTEAGRAIRNWAGGAARSTKSTRSIWTMWA